jgi:hypothetical protein
MLTDEMLAELDRREQYMRQNHFDLDRGDIGIDELRALLDEVKRLRAENARLCGESDDVRAELQCHSGGDTTDCPCAGMTAAELARRVSGENRRLRKENELLLAENKRLDAAETELITERDQLEERLEEFVNAVGGDAVCGEHSNLNDTWANALAEVDRMRRELAALHEPVKGPANG